MAIYYIHMGGRSLKITKRQLRRLIKESTNNTRISNIAKKADRLLNEQDLDLTQSTPENLKVLKAAVERIDVSSVSGPASELKDITQILTNMMESHLLLAAKDLKSKDDRLKDTDQDEIVRGLVGEASEDFRKLISERAGEIKNEISESAKKMVVMFLESVGG